MENGKLTEDEAFYLGFWQQVSPCNYEKEIKNLKDAIAQEFSKKQPNRGRLLVLRNQLVRTKAELN